MKKRYRGSLTIEAAVIVPMAMLVFVTAINGGISLYQNVRETAIKIESEKSIDIVNIFYRYKILEEFVDNEN